MNRPTLSSPPCFAHELEAGWQGYDTVDPQTAIDVARWRKAERARLIEARLAVPAGKRAEVANHVVFLHDGIIEEEGPPSSLYGAPRSERLRKFLASVQ